MKIIIDFSAPTGEGMLTISRRGCGQITPTGGKKPRGLLVLLCPRIAVWYTASTGWERRKD